MRYSIRTLLIIMLLFAFALVALKSTGEIWVFWYNGLSDWYAGAQAHIGLLFCVLSLGFISGWLTRTRVPDKTTKIVSLVAYVVLNVAMYSLARSAIQWVNFASVEQEWHITGAMNMLVVVVNSGVLLVFTCCSLAFVSVAAFVLKGKYLEVCGFFSIGCWFVIMAIGFANAAASMIQD